MRTQRTLDLRLRLNDMLARFEYAKPDHAAELFEVIKGDITAALEILGQVEDECYHPRREARKPHPLTMAGK